MSRILSRQKYQNMIFLTGIGLMLLALILYPTQSVTAAADSVNICANVILPSLFPFFVLSSLSVELGLIQALGKLLSRFMEPLFHISGSCAGAFLLGIVGGYPVGARTAISLYESGQCSKTEAERMLSFCNNSGPAFILGVVGAGIFSSSIAGLWLYGAHVAASVLVGLLFRNYGEKNMLKTAEYSPVIQEPVNFAVSFTKSVKQAFSSTLNICAFVIFFTVLIRLLFLTGLISGLAGVLSLLLGRIGLQSDLAESLITGMIEMTSGVWSLRDLAASMGSRLCMAAFILGWAGLSVHCQVLSFIGSSGLATRTYFLGKLLHGILSAVLIYLMSCLFGWRQSIPTYLASEVSTIAQLNFHQAILVSSVTAGLIWLFFTLISIICMIKDYGKRRKHRV